MGIKSGGFERKSKASKDVPASSLADIAFLLLIFFMVSTVFRTDRKRPIEWVEAVAAEKIDEKAKDILNIWMERNGDIWINDRPYDMTEVSGVVGPRYAQSERRLVISVRGDREVPYLYVDAIQKELVRAGVVRVVFAAELERNLTRARR